MGEFCYKLNGERRFDSDCSGDPLQVYKQISTLKTVMKQFAGKNIIITGGSKGIGRSVVEIFLKEGANVSIKILILLLKNWRAKMPNFSIAIFPNQKILKRLLQKLYPILEM